MWDKTIWAFISSCLGAIIGMLVNNAMDADWQNLTLIIAISILLLSIIAQLGPIKYIFAPRRNFILEGKWISEWSYKKNEYDVLVHEDLTIRQYGRYLVGKAESTSITGPHPFSKLKYTFRAVIRDDGFLHGEWKSQEQGRRYYGFLQGYISPGSHKVSIKWMGIETGGVHSGDCLWEKI